MRETVSRRQLMAFTFAAFSAPVTVAAAALPWRAVVPAAVGAACLWLLLEMLRRKAATAPLAECTVSLWGRPPGLALLTIQTAVLVMVLWRLAPEAQTAFPETRVQPWLTISLAGFCAYGCLQGRAAVLRALSVTFWVQIGLYLTLLLFALPNLDYSRLAAAPPCGDATPLVLLLLPVCGLFLAEPKEKKGGWLWGLPFVLLPAAVSVLCAAVPGSEGSFYTMAKSVVLFTAAQRVEPLASVAMLVGWYALLCLLALTAGELLAPWKLPPRGTAALLCLLSAGGYYLRLPISDGALALLAVLFCVFVPGITLLVDRRKKLKKISKKQLTNKN